MILVHVAVVGRVLHVWGETAPSMEAPRPSQRRKAKSPKRSSAPASPYDSGTAPLVEALEQAVPGLSLGGARAERLVAWLFERLADRGEIDFVTDFAGPLPALVSISPLRADSAISRRNSGSGT